MRKTTFKLLRIQAVLGAVLLDGSATAAFCPYQENSRGCTKLRSFSSVPGEISLKRKRQARRKPVNRRPKYYWNNISNIEAELRAFWEYAEVKIAPDEPPVIPNETLLNHFERYDLKNAIVIQGGREEMSQTLGGARIMPGKWADAVKYSPELQKLLKDTPGLSPHRPPLSPQQRKNANKSSGAHDIDHRWAHKEGRKPRGYWNKENVISELYDYLEECRETLGRPSVWMPRPSEIACRGREDLKLAIVRFFGGAKEIRRAAGLVPYRDWYWFMGLLELLVELQRYLDTFHDGIDEVFPSMTDIKSNGYDQLFRLVQFYGGRKFVASRLGMKHTNAGTLKKLDSTGFYRDMNWGPFSISFAIELMEFVHSEQMKEKPPLSFTAISMPSRRRLLESGEKGAGLHKNIEKFGGYENVARRLGLDFFRGT
mmetsp:Transcript_29872/g.45815  ORF Transcript_29872/g.45815 Transcript_29872/m.45815 type:complete len:427 (-) Transcript_29872:1240-2520(-)